MKISIIVPIYNAEDYLSSCLDSIINQTYSDFETILIDDGSTDKTSDILKSYTNKDKRLISFYQINGGVSQARNLALEKVKGRFLTFIDADDYVAPNYLKSLYEDIILNDADIVYQSVFKFFEDGETCKLFSFKHNILNVNDFFSKHNVGEYGYPFGKIFKVDYLKQNNIFFENDLKFGEDFNFTLKYLKFAKKIQLSSNTHYFYRISNNSLSTKLYAFEEEFKLLKKNSYELNKIFENNKINYINFNKQLKYYVRRVLISISKSSNFEDRKLNFEKLKLFNSNLLEYTVLQSRFIGKLLYIGLLIKSFFLFDLVYRNSDFLNGSKFKFFK